MGDSFTPTLSRLPGIKQVLKEVCQTRQRWSDCQKSAKRSEERWTFLLPQGSDGICPTPCADSFRHNPLGEWMAGITLLASQGWYLTCIISFFPQFSIVKSSIKLDWARLSRPVLECSGEITLKGTRPWLSGRLVHASSQAQLLTLQRACDILEDSGNPVGPSSQLRSLLGLQIVITPGPGCKALFYFLFLKGGSGGQRVRGTGHQVRAVLWHSMLQSH